MQELGQVVSTKIRRMKSFFIPSDSSRFKLVKRLLRKLYRLARKFRRKPFSKHREHSFYNNMSLNKGPFLEVPLTKRNVTRIPSINADHS